ncbi:MAG TPA: hypothetical protein VMU87_00855 [Stellaceae bacterium]|nr:hypothetical protein [Stellaceae bacterium]
MRNLADAMTSALPFRLFWLTSIADCRALSMPCLARGAVRRGVVLGPDRPMLYWRRRRSMAADGTRGLAMLKTAHGNGNGNILGRDAARLFNLDVPERKLTRAPRIPAMAG